MSSTKPFPVTPLPEGPSPGIGDLQAMFDELESAPEIYRPTEFWQQFAELHLQQLNEDGFELFKQTINRNYFQFELTNPLHSQARLMWSRWIKRPKVAPLRSSYSDGYELPLTDVKLGRRARQWTYSKYVALLSDRVRELDKELLLDELDEPLTGHPVCVDYRGRRTSEDLCNSVLEYSAVRDALPAETLKDATVIELGSGYGRLAWVYLKVEPSVRYILVDIPPALAVAEQYLAECFPDRKIFGFRHFENAAEVSAELDQAQIAFLTPNQLDLLPELKADLFINVSSLHEMVQAQIDHYFDVIADHTSGYFYSKQWIKSTNAADDVVIERERYPVRSEWKTVFDREHPIQQAFFEALYDLNPNG
ncbi:MAG: putative sugar O-methyltransferase [Solirubrobacterales bacterium]